MFPKLYDAAKSQPVIVFPTSTFQHHLMQYYYYKIIVYSVVRQIALLIKEYILTCIYLLIQSLQFRFHNTANVYYDYLSASAACIKRFTA